MANEEVLREIAADLAVVRYKVEALPELVARVEKIEQKDLKRTAWAAGASAVLSAIAAAITWAAPGCWDASTKYTSKAEAHEMPADLSWKTKPILFVDTALPDDCKVAIDEALIFWQTHGVLLPEAIPAKSPKTVVGSIVFAHSEPENEDHAGITYSHTRGSDMVGAEVHLRHYFCRWALVSAHELGHALGLNDLYEPSDIGNIMYFSTLGMGTHVTDAQIEQIK